MSYQIRTFCAGKAHEEVVRKILKYGIPLGTEDNEATLELPEPSCIHISTPLAEPMISPFSVYSEAYMEEYTRKFIDGYDAGQGFEYNYHDCLHAWGSRTLAKTPGAVLPIVDQVCSVIALLKRSPTTRRAQVITWEPPVDLGSREPPCLQLIQFLLRQGRLNMKVVFRSNDMLMAAGCNMYALIRFQERVAANLGVEVGWYEHTSNSAHIYYKRDHPDLWSFIDGMRLEQEIPDLMSKLV